jgi:hypothetical protein
MAGVVRGRGGLIMGFVRVTDSGGWKAFWRDPSGAQRSKTFRTKKEATHFLSQVQVSISSGAYVSPHASRTLFGDHVPLRCLIGSERAAIERRGNALTDLDAGQEWFCQYD